MGARQPTASRRGGATRRPAPPVEAAVPRLETLGALPLMLAGVLAIYGPLAVLTGRAALLGIDFVHIHERRIRYAQEHLLGPSPFLPAWYSRELLGTPFWSNIQSFPLIPVRLLVLGLPSELTFAGGVALAALLAALFTFLYARRIGLRPLGAAVAGWTFACAGYFASRVLGGHFPVLEAYPALPLLFWLIERTLRAPADGRGQRAGVLAIGLASAATMLAGHPQLPLYATGSAVAYALVRARGATRVRLVGAVIAGIGVASVALWPMLGLIARSTRLLRLDAPINDIALPSWRIGALVAPWKDGWPALVARHPATPFAGPDHYFWDTVSYVGGLPLLAVAILVARAVARRRREPAPWPFLAALGLVAFVLALPPAKIALSVLPGTLLRSPARLLYLTTFALALAAGLLLDALARGSLVRGGRVIALLLTAAHVADLGAHAMAFVVPMPRTPAAVATSAEARAIEAAVGDGRIAVDYEISGPVNRRMDDVGFFDSIMLARPYGALLDLGGESPTRNVQTFDGSALPAAALAYLGARVVVTPRPRSDLAPVEQAGGVNVYRVPDAQARVHFVPAAAAVYLDEAAIRGRLRRPGPELLRTIMLPIAPATTPAPVLPGPEREPRLAYRRVSSDAITVDVTASGPGFVRVLETWDPGWRATLDGASTEILLADGFVMAIPVAPGSHRIDLRYTTPGARTGALLSLIGLAALLALAVAWPARRPRQETVTDLRRGRP